jgi:4'-phosphopantetheinyl transferase
LESTLAPDEKERARRFVHRQDREDFMAARGILRELLGRYTGREAAEVEFEYGARGKPSLREGRTVQFNISHSHGMALLAFSAERSLGVDVELIREDFGGEEIAARYFSGREIQELRALPASLRAEGFFQCWTRKEAYIKARGEGMQIPLDSFSVSLTPGQPERLESADSEHWSLRALRPDARYVGAVVGEGSGWELRCGEWKAGESR